MKRINLQAKFECFENQSTVVISLDYTQAKDVCLLFILLNEKLIDNLELKLDNSSLYFQLTDEKFSVCRFYDSKSRIFKSLISKDSLEYIIHFLLKYYRDEIGEAEHIDIDFENQNKELTTLIIKSKYYMEYTNAEIQNLIDN